MSVAYFAIPRLIFAPIISTSPIAPKPNIKWTTRTTSCAPPGSNPPIRIANGDPAWRHGAGIGRAQRGRVGATVDRLREADDIRPRAPPATAARGVPARERAIRLHDREEFRR